MLIKQKEVLDPQLKKQLSDYVYDVIGVVQAVHNELPQGMPEYIYQEALTMALEQAGMKPVREYQHHPLFRGEPMKSFLKMDMVVPRERGNIIIECKAIEKLSQKGISAVILLYAGNRIPRWNTSEFPQLS